ncbi:MAG: dihydroorotate dehydrogenase [Candidatus Latescibacteria bacterium]|nr:dihydroorotate dehydrogenase [Candidatus Latescibacterota bacterium]
MKKTQNIKIKNLIFKNPLILASGTFSFGDKFISVVNQMGGIITKGITLQPRPGNPMPRIWETASGLLNSVGLENPGIDAFLKNILPGLAQLKTNLIVNISGNQVKDFTALAEKLSDADIDGIEINVSCPNIRETDKMLGQDPKTVFQVVSAVRRKTDKFLITKLTANFIDPLLTAQAAKDAGSDAVCLVNTLYGIALDSNTGKPMLGGIFGGLSGPAIKPFALFCVWRVASRLKIPIVGCGGICSADDVREFLHAGSSLVQIGSANLRNPYAGLEILHKLSDKNFKGGVK